jgi:hypothetical protein
MTCQNLWGLQSPSFHHRIGRPMFEHGFAAPEA